jgi:hypothetical protein
MFAFPQTVKIHRLSWILKVVSATEQFSFTRVRGSVTGFSWIAVDIQALARRGSPNRFLD